MARKTTITGELEVHGHVNAEKGILLLQEQVEKARKLLNNRPVRSKDLVAWNKSTRNYLVMIYGSGSPNIQTVIYSPGEGPVWLGMPDSVYDKYEASSLENKIERLNNCIVWLKKEVEMSSNEKIKERGYQQRIA